jgi:hypothetical protein
VKNVLGAAGLALAVLSAAPAMGQGSSEGAPYGPPSGSGGAKPPTRTISAPEFDAAAAGTIAALVAGGGVILARRRRR